MSDPLLVVTVTTTTYVLARRRRHQQAVLPAGEGGEAAGNRAGLYIKGAVLRLCVAGAYRGDRVAGQRGPADGEEEGLTRRGWAGSQQQGELVA